MSVQQIEDAIAKLKPADKRKVAAWISEHCSENAESKRPRLREAVFTPVRCSPDAFAPLNDEELAAFGLS